MLDSSSFWRGLHGRAVRVATVALASIIYLATPLGWSGGTVNAADQTLTVNTATGNQLVLGQPIQITVAAKSDTLMSGKIVITGDSSGPIEYAIDVPAGTTKELKIIGMPLQYPQEGYQIVWFDADGKRVASTNLRSALQGGDTVVGVFPSIGTDFPETISQPTDTDSHLYTIPDDQLELPSLAFGQYDVIVATLEDVQNLDDNLLSAFRSWLGGGGRLVLDDGDGAAVAKALDIAEPADHYGDGEILLTAGALRPDGWEAATQPVGARSIASLGPIGWMTGGGGIGVESPTQSLVKYSGDPLMGTGLLLLLGAGYVLIVGPLMFIAFRRRRRALWVVGPTIAIVACSLIWLDSARRRDSIHDAHGTVVAVSDVGSEVLSGEMLYVRSDKPVGVDLPADYTLTPSFDNFDTKSVAVSAEGTKISQKAEVGSFVLYSGMGPAEQFDGQLTGTVTAEEDSASGEVTNRLAVDLHQVAIMWNGLAKNIGDVKAGETVKYTIDKSNRVAEMPAMTVWGDSFDDLDWWTTKPKPSGKPRPDVVSLAVWDYAATVDPLIGQTQNVDVAGWTDELDSPITGSPHGVSFVTAKIEGEANADSGRSSFVYTVEAPNVNGWSAESLVRLDAPAGVTDPVVTLGKVWQSAELLIGGEWVAVNPDATRSIVIPTSMLDEAGGIYLKADINLERISGWFELPTLHSAEPDEKTVPLAEALAQSDDNSTATGASTTTVAPPEPPPTTIPPPASLPGVEG